MKIGGSYGYGFDPYSNYTEILKKSAYMGDNGAMSVNTAAVSEAEQKGQKSPEIDNAIENVKSLSTDEILGVSAERKDADVNTVAESLRGIRDFEMIGRDSDINDLDAVKSVGKQQTDALLMQYQYFVTPN